MYEIEKTTKKKKNLKMEIQKRGLEGTAYMRQDIKSVVDWEPVVWCMQRGGKM